MPGGSLTVTAESDAGGRRDFTVITRIDTPNEVGYFLNGGILPYVLRHTLQSRKTS